MTAQAEKVLIVGSGGEVGQIVEAIALGNASRARPWEIVGILDDNSDLHGHTAWGHRVLGPLAVARERAACRLVWGLGNPRRPGLRLEIAHRLELPSHRFLSVVHPQAFVSKHAEVAPGALVLAGARVTAGVRLGAHVAIGFNSVMEHDSSVGHGTLVAGGALIAGRTRIGAGAFVGQGANIKDGLTIGDIAVIGMGSVVVHDVHDGETVMGVPARVQKTEPVSDEFYEQVAYVEGTLRP